MNHGIASALHVRIVTLPSRGNDLLAATKSLIALIASVNYLRNDALLVAGRLPASAAPDLFHSKIGTGITTVSYAHRVKPHLSDEGLSPMETILSVLNAPNRN